MAVQADTSVRRTSRLPWAMVALAVIIVGLVITIRAAQTSARDVANARRHEREAIAFGIGSDLNAALLRQQDLVVSTGAVFAADPDLATLELASWLDRVDAGERHPEVVAVAVMRAIADSELDEFAAQLRNDPDGALGPSGELQIVPPGPRPTYCLLQSVVLTDGSPFVGDPGIDYCDGAIGTLIVAARDSGSPSYIATPVDGVDQLIVQTPIYVGGEDPGDPTARRAKYLGSLGTSIAPDVLFDELLQDRDGFTITLNYASAASVRRAFAATFDSGVIDGPVESIDHEFQNDWSATVAWAATQADWWTSAAATRILVAGSSASLVLGILLFVLGTGRRRALRLVEQRTDQLNRQALHDGLTGLPNRTLIFDRGEQLLERCRRNGTVGAAMYLDLDGFKEVNDTLGHDAGDQLLQSVAARLTASLRGVDTIGRIGGDEFVVLVDEGNLETGSEVVAERILEALRQPFHLDLAAQALSLTASIGIAAGDRPTAGDLLRDADIALYHAKKAGRDRYEVFRHDMEVAVQRHFELDHDLLGALDAGQFELFYQPIYNLSDLTMTGAEALIRWQHPSGMTIPPAEFLPTLEATGQIIEVGRWVLDQACRQASRWQADGNGLVVSINLSAKQLEHDSIVQHVSEALDANGIDSQRIALEINEAVVMRDPDATIRRLHELRALGVRLAIDDFGSGYASLSYLQLLPVDSLKIDRSLIDTINRTNESDAVISTLVQLGKALDLSILAEGVETADQLDYLRHVDVDEAQGFLLAHPLTTTDFVAGMQFPSKPPVVITPATSSTS